MNPVIVALLIYFGIGALCVGLFSWLSDQTERPFEESQKDFDQEGVPFLVYQILVLLVWPVLVIEYIRMGFRKDG